MSKKTLEKQLARWLQAETKLSYTRCLSLVRETKEQAERSYPQHGEFSDHWYTAAHGHLRLAGETESKPVAREGR